MGRFIDSAANALDGNGDKLRQTIAQLSGVGRILANGSGNIVDIIKNLQTFVTALRDSNSQIVQFQNRLATLTSVLDGSRSDLDAALKDLSVAVGEVQRFIAGSRDQTAEEIQRLANVTQNLVDHQRDLEQVLHVSPTAFANAYNVYNPDTGSALGAFALTNFSNPVQLVCSAIGAVRKRDRAGNGEAVRAVPRPRAALAELQRAADTVQPVSDEVGEPGEHHLLRAEPGPRRRRAQTGSTGDPPCGIRVHGLERRCAAAAGIWAASRGSPGPVCTQSFAGTSVTGVVPGRTGADTTGAEDSAGDAAAG